MISIHAPARGATFSDCLYILMEYSFQSTLPRGERPAYLYMPSSLLYFNPRSREGSDNIQHFPFRNLYDFNPRSREGSDLHQSQRFISGKNISIHAPARGATYTGPISRRRVIFQSTLPRGERLQFPEKTPVINYFNPRSREGSDCNMLSGVTGQ